MRCHCVRRSMAALRRRFCVPGAEFACPHRGVASEHRVWPKPLSADGGKRVREIASGEVLPADSVLSAVLVAFGITAALALGFLP